MQLVVVLIFVSAGLALAGQSFRKFPWQQKPSRREYLTTLLVHLAIGGGIGFLAGGWAAGRLPP
jgi:hypothetical protein